jgi:NitT/TauT family transport system substrate-binding protein
MENAAIAFAVDTMTGGREQLNNGYMAHLVGGSHIVSQAGTEDAPAVADVAMNADTQLLRYSVERPDLRMLFTATRGHYEILARRSAGITAPADLRGKRIGTFPRTSSEYFLITELAHYGIPEDEVEIVPFIPELAVSQALIDAEVDAISIWEPATQHAKEGLGDDAVRLYRPGSYYLRLNANTTAAALADPGKRAEIVSFIQHVILASEKVTASPELGAGYLARMSGFDPGLVLRCLHSLEFVALVEDDQLDILVEQERWVAREQNRRPRGREELAPLIDTSAYEEAVAGLAARRSDTA